MPPAVGQLVLVKGMRAKVLSIDEAGESVKVREPEWIKITYV